MLILTWIVIERDGDIGKTRQNLCLLCILEALLVKERLKTIAVDDLGLSSQESIQISLQFSLAY